jgi:hypothetical protein
MYVYLWIYGFFCIGNILQKTEWTGICNNPNSAQTTVKCVKPWKN